MPRAEVGGVDAIVPAALEHEPVPRPAKDATRRDAPRKPHFLVEQRPATAAELSVVHIGGEGSCLYWQRKGERAATGELPTPGAAGHARGQPQPVEAGSALIRLHPVRGREPQLRHFGSFELGEWPRVLVPGARLPAARAGKRLAGPAECAYRRQNRDHASHRVEATLDRWPSSRRQTPTSRPA